MRVIKVVLLIFCILIIVFLIHHKNNLKYRTQLQIKTITNLNWICYAPTNFNPKENIYPSIQSIKDDLILLKNNGFDGVITYECRNVLAHIPEIARTIGLEVIQGIWDPANKKELDRAVEKSHIVQAYCIGNEGLGTRYSLRDLDQGVTYIANKTGIPVGISEQIHLYFQQPKLIDIGDWIFPIVHPHFGNAKSIENATTWIRENTRQLGQLAAEHNQNKIIFIKEIGMPSSGDPVYNESKQAEFFDYLVQQMDLPYAIFEAFDRQGWEYISPVEPYWGIFHQDRSLKLPAKRIKRILLN